MLSGVLSERRIGFRTLSLTWAIIIFQFNSECICIRTEWVRDSQSLSEQWQISSVQNEREFPASQGRLPSTESLGSCYGALPNKFILIQILLSKIILKKPSEPPQKNIYSRNITVQTSDTVQVILSSVTVKLTICVMELFLYEVLFINGPDYSYSSFNKSYLLQQKITHIFFF